MTRINKVEELTGGTMQQASANVKSGSYDPYKALASAIVEQAAKDLRRAYRRRFNANDRIAEYQAAVAELEAAIAEADGEGDDEGLRRLHGNLVAARRMLTKARQMLTMAERSVDECESFFVGDWFDTLSDLDGPTLLDEIEREERIWHRKKVGACQDL